jgi:invasion protein IalB
MIRGLASVRGQGPGRLDKGSTNMATFHGAQFLKARRMQPRGLIGAVVLLIAAVSLGGKVAAQGVIRSVNGDWQIRCDTLPGAKDEQCALIQTVMAEDRPNVGLKIIVLKTADGKTTLMRVEAPLGVLIPSGLGLKIDNDDVGRAGFVKCSVGGCLAEVVMDANLIQKLRNGQTATFIIFQSPEEGIGLPVSLKGFGEGFDKLP